MKAVYSFISKPFFKNNSSKTVGGFYDLESFYCSWALSVLLSKKHFEKVELYTDEKGADLLDVLNLPFDSISTELDVLNYDTELWALGKIVTYNKQTEPFLHIDYDAFLWEPLHERFLKADFISQYKEEGYLNYDKPIAYFHDNAFYKPSHVNEYFSLHGKSAYALNCGVFGGYNVEAIKEYSNESLLTVSNALNMDMWYKLRTHHSNKLGLLNDFNILIEQFFAGAYSKVNDLNVQTLLENHENTVGSDNVKFTHLLAQSKSSERNCINLKNKLKSLYSDYHYLIQRHINKKRLVK